MKEFSVSREYKKAFLLIAFFWFGGVLQMKEELPYIHRKEDSRLTAVLKDK